MSTKSGEAVNPVSNCKTGASPLPQFSDVRVLVVDDEASARNVLALVLAQIGHRCEKAANGEEALRILEEKQTDVVISDLQMPGISGMELLAKVRQLYPHLVFLVVTGTDDIQVGIRAMQEGADDYLVKPFQVDASVVSTSLARALHKKRLEQEVENYRRHLEEMVAEQTQQLREALREVERSYEHTLEAMGGLEHELKNIAMGAWLHDIGKLAIPDAILLKPGSLTDEERQVMQRHVQIGYDLVKGIPFLSNAAEIILGHHERCDGSGYPRGLKAEEIPVGARIFAVADTFDAMTSDRPYRRALPFAASREVIERGAGKQYDAHVARVFLSTPDETWQEIRRETAAIQVFSVAAADYIQALSRLVKPGS